MIVRVDTFPTYVATIDRALGCGGLPQGRIMELFGWESSGKTTTCLQFISACQRHYFPDPKGRQGVAAFIDAEHSFDPDWATKCGVHTDDLLFSQPGSGEEAFDIVERLAESGLVDLIVVDSVAALVPQVELDGAAADITIGAQARLMSKGLRKIRGKAHSTKTTVIFINQLRQKIGVMFGNSDTTSGGNALKFYASIRAQVNKGSPLKVGDVTVGFRPTIKFIKNKVAPPFTTAEFEICVGKPERPVSGIDEVASLIEVGEELKIIEKASSWYSLGGQRLGNGLMAATTLVRESPKIMQLLREKIYGSLMEKVHTATEVDEDDSADPDTALSDELLDRVVDHD